MYFFFSSKKAHAFAWDLPRYIYNISKRLFDHETPYSIGFENLPAGFGVSCSGFWGAM
jgi:hypothetical protein